jgi:hypothetical protein
MARTSFAFPFALVKCGLFSGPFMPHLSQIAGLGFVFWPFCEIADA